jgi:Zn-dependent protease
VPVTWQNLKQPKRDMVFVAAAGPMSNLVMALLWALAIRIGLALGDAGLALVFMGVAGIFINTILMVLNLLPLPPLDGGRVMTGLLPGPLAYKFSLIEPYGFFILVGLLVTGLLGVILWPVIEFFMGLMAGISGLQPRTFMAVLMALLGK